MQATNIVIGRIITVKSSCALPVIKKKKISERIGLRWGLKISENSWKEIAKPIGKILREFPKKWKNLGDKYACHLLKMTTTKSQHFVSINWHAYKKAGHNHIIMNTYAPPQA